MCAVGLFYAHHNLGAPDGMPLFPHVSRIATPETISKMSTNFFAIRSLTLCPLHIPRNSPTSIKGINTTTCFRDSNVRMPHIPYKTMRTVFSTKNTTQILALKELLSSVTLLTYAPNSAPIP